MAVIITDEEVAAAAVAAVAAEAAVTETYTLCSVRLDRRWLSVESHSVPAQTLSL